MSKKVNLSEKIDDTEDLARVICAGSKRKNYKAYFDKDPNNHNNYLVQPSVFIDHRNPMELSVNRIATLSEKEAHELGLQHKKDGKISQSYNGYAKVKAKMCYELGCKLEKDDVNGTKPYHANIIYPFSAKEDCMEIANQLAFSAELILFQNTDTI